jgi:hypothetical protein
MSQLKSVLATKYGGDQSGWAIVTGAALAERAGAGR